MAQHGYLGEGYGAHGDHDPNADRDRERGWREREDRSFMFEGRERFSPRDERGSDAGEWFGGREPEGGRVSRYGREHGYGGFQGDFSGGREQGGFGGQGDYARGRRSFSSRPDDHYLSWRQKQIEALDRDYEEYCQECEQRFEQDFQSWRRNRQSRPSGQQQAAMGEKDELLLNRTASGTTSDVSPDPDSAATMDQAESPPTTGRGRG